MVEVPYKKDFDERNILTKACPIQMNKQLLEFYQNEIQSLLNKKLIRPSKHPRSYAPFNVHNQAKQK